MARRTQRLDPGREGSGRTLCRANPSRQPRNWDAVTIAIVVKVTAVTAGARQPMGWTSGLGNCRRSWWTVERPQSVRLPRRRVHRWRNGRARLEAGRTAESDASAGRVGAKRRRTPRFSSALVPEASTVATGEAVAGYDAIARTKSGGVQRKVGTAPRETRRRMTRPVFQDVVPSSARRRSRMDEHRARRTRQFDLNRTGGRRKLFRA